MPPGAMWELDGLTFVRFASRLIYYAGAVQGKLKYDYSEVQDDGSVRLNANSSGPSKKMSMSEAMKQYSTAEDLDALNLESESAMGGTLFERVTVPAT